MAHLFKQDLFMKNLHNFSIAYTVKTCYTEHVLMNLKRDNAQREWGTGGFQCGWINI